MGLITKIIKYGAIFAAGYYLASCTCKPYTKPSGLEQEEKTVRPKSIETYLNIDKYYGISKKK